MKFQTVAISLFLIAIISSCGPAVRVTGEWTNPAVKADTSYDKVMVTAMVSNEPAKRAIENAFENQLQQVNVAITKAYEVFPTMFSDQFERDQDKMLSKIQETENDAILAISILDQDTETRYVPGTAGAYRPVGTYGWYGNFWGYYNYYYPTVYDPGYYTTTQIYYIEANLYDAESEKLVWSAQTETYDPAKLERFASDFAETVVESLTGEGFLDTSQPVQTEQGQ